MNRFFKKNKQDTNNNIKNIDLNTQDIKISEIQTSQQNMFSIPLSPQNSQKQLIPNNTPKQKTAKCISNSNKIQNLQIPFENQKNLKKNQNSQEKNPQNQTKTTKNETEKQAKITKKPRKSFQIHPEQIANLLQIPAENTQKKKRPSFSIGNKLATQELLNQNKNNNKNNNKNINNNINNSKISSFNSCDSDESEEKVKAYQLQQQLKINDSNYNNDTNNQFLIKNNQELKKSQESEFGNPQLFLHLQRDSLLFQQSSKLSAFNNNSSSNSKNVFDIFTISQKLIKKKSNRKNSIMNSESQSDTNNKNGFMAQSSMSQNTDYKKQLQKKRMETFKREPYKQWNFVKILGKVKRFIDKIKLYSPGQSFYEVCEYHLILINDLVYQNDDIKIRSFCEKLILFFSYLGNLIGVFTPDQFFINIWKIYIIFVTVVMTFLVPYQACFKDDFNSQSKEYTIFGIVPAISFVLDFILQFNTSYYYEGSNVTNRLEILKHYLKTTLFLDIVNLNQQNWINSLDYPLQNESDKYIYAIYFSFITVGTIGYGDIHPSNNIEFLYVIFMTIVSTFIVGYTVNTIGTIFQDQSKKIAEFKKMQYELQNYMSTRQITQNVQVKVRKYLEYIDSKSTESPERGQETINLLSPSLREEIKQDFFGKILHEMKIFRFNFSQRCREQLALCMEEKMFGPGEIIYDEDEEDHRIFYIIKGNIEILIKKKQENDKNKQYFSYDRRFGNESFGEFEFFTPFKRDSQARSINVSHLAYVSQHRFMNILKKNKNDFEKFCELRDQIIMHENKLAKRCYGCHYKYGHTIVDCPFMHFIRDKFFLIRKHNFVRNNEREEYTRKGQKFRTLTNKIEVYRGMRKQRKEIVFVLQYDSDRESQDSFVSSDGSVISECDKEFQKRMPALKYEKNDYVLRFSSDSEDFFNSSSENLYNNEKMKNKQSDSENCISEEEFYDEEFSIQGRKNSIYLNRKFSFLSKNNLQKMNNSLLNQSKSISKLQNLHNSNQQIQLPQNLNQLYKKKASIFSNNLAQGLKLNRPSQIQFELTGKKQNKNEENQENHISPQKQGNFQFEPIIEMGDSMNKSDGFKKSKKHKKTFIQQNQQQNNNQYQQYNNQQQNNLYQQNQFQEQKNKYMSKATMENSVYMFKSNLNNQSYQQYNYGNFRANKNAPNQAITDSKKLGFNYNEQQDLELSKSKIFQGESKQKKFKHANRFLPDLQENPKLLFLYDMTKIENYENYFPHNNFDVVLQEANQFIKENQHISGQKEASGNQTGKSKKFMKQFLSHLISSNNNNLITNQKSKTPNNYTNTNSNHQLRKSALQNQESQDGLSKSRSRLGSNFDASDTNESTKSKKITQKKLSQEKNKLISFRKSKEDSGLQKLNQGLVNQAQKIEGNNNQLQNLKLLQSNSPSNSFSNSKSLTIKQKNSNKNLDSEELISSRNTKNSKQSQKNRKIIEQSFNLDQKISEKAQKGSFLQNNSPENLQNILNKIDKNNENLGQKLKEEKEEKNSQNSIKFSTANNYNNNLEINSNFQKSPGTNSRRSSIRSQTLNEKYSKPQIFVSQAEIQNDLKKNTYYTDSIIEEENNQNNNLDYQQKKQKVIEDLKTNLILINNNKKKNSQQKTQNQKQSQKLTESQIFQQKEKNLDEDESLSKLSDSNQINSQKNPNFLTKNQNNQKQTKSQQQEEEVDEQSDLEFI
ncbi:Cyclic nucleotide-binding protein [Pseudocohnilembus persalinus]|uniref:Cyclic nucleotide-binding protein n=1 Tax=Pseudocohnilembus persalinus TaxID=266149 RepID=A0A0V0R607_PSEPJ|nr:Cyclic nucleotide-binding protein [Pseudocohnilembus persalinus]|eukprot:KRX09786.1 Cyclic nucleotide-binding protein [Pseudocohnilembus persalinus]